MRIRTALLILGVFAFQDAFTQSSIYVRNSTWQDFNVNVTQSGASVNAGEWTVPETLAKGWYETTGHEVLSINRGDTTLANGDTAIFKIDLNGETDSLSVLVRLVGVSGGTEMDFSIEGNGFSEPWYDDGDFHDVNTTLDGKSVVIKFKPDNDDSNMDRDVRFAIHDLPVYEIDAADHDDPNILNAMFFNVQMLPLGISGMGQASERAALFPAQISPYQDVVAYCEVFDNGPREDHLIPAMEDAGFPYYTTILNDPGLIPFPWNGGVMIFSKWPIEAEGEIDFELCGEASQDCLANKGVKYAKVNKLGKMYHVFATHMDAGGGADDIEARRSQMAEIRDMIADLNIPDGEAVVFGGDFNTDPTGSDIDYAAFLDTMSPVIPQHIGYYESNFGDDFGNIIDHAWVDRLHLIPTVATNEVITFRSLDPTLWDISEFSDHRCVLGRFEYPNIEKIGGDTLICPDEDMLIGVQTDHPATLTWYKDGVDLGLANQTEIQFNAAQESESGLYTCQVQYEVVYGDWGDSLNAVFYPDGIDTVQANLSYEYNILIDEVLCSISVKEGESETLRVYPNPTTGLLRLELDGREFDLIQISNMIGQEVHRTTVVSETTTIDVSTLQAGSYTVSAIDASGERFREILVVQ